MYQARLISTSLVSHHESYLWAGNKLALFYIQKQFKASIGTELQWMSMTKKIMVSAYWMCILRNVQNSQAGMNIFVKKMVQQSSL